jgi:fatty-acyl-CoA synthase
MSLKISNNQVKPGDTLANCGLSRWINHWAVATPNKIAIIFGDQQYSYSRLASAIAKLAAVFKHEFGIKEGDRVAYLGNNSPRIIEALLACARTGAILVPLNWRLAVPELLEILADAGASLLIVGEDQAGAATAIIERLDSCRPVHAYQDPHCSSPGHSWPGLQALQDQSEVAGTEIEDRSGQPVLILYTSGTTGWPKGAVLTQNALLRSAQNSVAMHDMTADDRILAVLPMFHAGGLNIQTLPALYAGATVILHPGYGPEAVLASIASDLPSLTALVPAQINPLVAHSDWSTTDMNHLRCVTTGSTFVPDSCIEPWIERGVVPLKVYGATETCAVAIHQTQANVDLTAGSVGFAAKHCQIRIVDNEGHDVTAGEHGQILIKGTNVFKEYWHNSVATENALRGGWFHSGDIGYCRPDGSYVISDRKADLIISGGENIYPAELEAVLDEHPEIAEAAVVGQPDERWGEVPVAFVVTKKASHLDSEGVRALFKNRLARFKHPHRVMLVDKLPRNAMGKVEKFELRKQLNQDQEQSRGD